MADLRRAWLMAANLSGVATNSRADFRGAQLDDAKLFQARLDDGDFRDASFVSGDAEEAVLFLADFSNAYLKGARFRRADLKHASFRGANIVTRESTTQGSSANPKRMLSAVNTAGKKSPRSSRCLSSR